MTPPDPRYEQFLVSAYGMAAGTLGRPFLTDPHAVLLLSRGRVATENLQGEDLVSALERIAAEAIVYATSTRSDAAEIAAAFTQGQLGMARWFYGGFAASALDAAYDAFTAVRMIVARRVPAMVN